MSIHTSSSKHPQKCMCSANEGGGDRLQRCRPEWAEFKPDYQAGEKQPAYKERVGAVLHFSKQAPASRQILYPGEFAAEGREIAAAARASGAASVQSGSQTASDQPVQLPVLGAEFSDDAEGSPPTFLPPQLEPDWAQGSLSPWCGLPKSKDWEYMEYIVQCIPSCHHTACPRPAMRDQCCMEAHDYL